MTVPLQCDSKERCLIGTRICSRQDARRQNETKDRKKKSPHRSQAGWNPAEQETVLSACFLDPGGCCAVWRLAHIVTATDMRRGTWE